MGYGGGELVGRRGRGKGGVVLFGSPTGSVGRWEGSGEYLWMLGGRERWLVGTLFAGRMWGSEGMLRRKGRCRLDGGFGKGSRGGQKVRGTSVGLECKQPSGFYKKQKKKHI